MSTVKFSKLKTVSLANFSKLSKKLNLNPVYTPGIYADGYIVFAFPFVRSSVRMFVRSFVRGICVKVLR